MRLARKLRLVVLAASLALLALALGAGSASASTGWWVLSSGAAPTDLQPGQKAMILATAVNSGYQPISSSVSEPLVIKDTLPAGLEIVEANANVGPAVEDQKPVRTPHHLKCTPEGQTITCPFVGDVEQIESMRLRVLVQVSPTLPETSVTNTVELSGGSVPTPPPLTRTFDVSSAPTPFGVEQYEMRPENDTGGLETQAGAHPFQLTTIFNLNQTLKGIAPAGLSELLPNAPALVKDLHFVLPAGLVGKAARVPKCSGANFSTLTPGDANLCPENTAIGYAVASVVDPILVGYLHAEVPVFNLEPDEGEPARFGFEVHDVPVVLTTHVLSGKSYGVEVTVNEATESAAVLSTQLTLWGVPNDPRHDSERGWQCLEEGFWDDAEKPCKSGAQLEKEENEQFAREGKPQRSEPEAFLTMPASCQTGLEPGLVSTADGEAWNGASFGEDGAEPVQASFKPFTGCEKLNFEPSISVTPDKTEAATPSGYTVDVEVPQSGLVAGKEGSLAEAAVKETTLTLPPGVVASAGASQHLGTCTSKGFGFEGGLEPELGESELAGLFENDHFTENPLNAESCPESAKIGTVEIESPLLEEDLYGGAEYISEGEVKHYKGGVYLAREDTAPFHSPLVLYIFAESPVSHVRVKLAGEVQISSTGQLKSIFRNTPPLPFHRLTLHLNDGPQASQTTPERCSPTNETTASFLASTGAVHEARSNFAISTGPGGASCSQPFAPSFQAGADSPQAGAFSPFRVTIRKPDGQNQLRSISVTEPPGAAAVLASVTPCPTAIAEALAPEVVPRANEQATVECPESSEVGTSTAIAGLGTGTYGSGAARVALGGKLYLTGPYHGAPFGLLDVTNAEKVGPFDLGKIGVLSTITVNETTAQATVTSNPLPQYVQGVPASISEIQVAVDRPGFTFNPTNCSALSVTGTLTGWGMPGVAEGSEALSYPYHAANCASLPFKPTLEVSVEAAASRSTGSGLVITVKSSPGEANIGKTKLEFPKLIPSRLETLKKSCRDTTFDVNPASCSPESIVGTAVAKTPVLKSPLTGPVYLVSHGNAAFPDAEILLQGEGIKLTLDGSTEITKAGVTISSFESVPDAPVESFVVTLPRGPKSAFTVIDPKTDEAAIGTAICGESLLMPTKFTGQNGAVVEQNTKINITGCGGVKHFQAESELAKNLKKCDKLSNKKKRATCVASAHRRANALAACKKAKKGKRAACETTARKKNALKL